MNGEAIQTTTSEEWRKTLDENARKNQERREQEDGGPDAAGPRAYHVEIIDTAREAERILREGRPLDYFLKTFQMDHEGDLNVARSMCMIFASSAVASGTGLHGDVSGPSGCGKSHSVLKMASQLPKKYRFNGPFSEKYLYYACEGSNGINPGTVIVIDDKTLSDTLQEMIKEYTTHYHEGIPYNTVVNQKPKELKIPARLSFVFMKVDEPGDDQILNRFIQCRVTDGIDKAKAASRKILGNYTGLLKKKVRGEHRELLICREMWDLIKSDLVAVEIPCANDLVFSDFNNLRNHEIFVNIMSCHAAIHRWQRKIIGETEDGIPVYLATRDDFKEASLIFEALFTHGGQRHNTTAPEDRVIKALLALNPEDGIFTIHEVAREAGMEYHAARRAFTGRRATGNAEMLGGLLQKCPAIQRIGKRGRKVSAGVEPTPYGEVTIHHNFNEDIYKADIPALRGWVGEGSPVWLAPGYKWDDAL